MRNLARTLVSLLLLYGCNACGGAAAGGDVDPGAPGSRATPGTGPRPAINRSTTPTDDVAMAENRFAIDLYQELRSADGNLAMSPASISLALGMTMAGARGDTASIMARTLHVDAIDDPHAAYAAQLARWNDAARAAYELRVANRLFGERSLRFHDAFVQLTGSRYGAPLEPVDFANAAGGVRRHINGWVEDQTDDRIRDLLPDGSIDGSTKLVLANAIYFKGRWASEFEARDTRPRAFRLAGGASADVPTMHQHGTFQTASADGVRLLELPYAGGELSMVVLLPDDPNGLAAVEERLSADRLAEWIAALSEEDLDVALPRFRIDPPRPIELRSALSALGMELPFTAAADFGGMSDAPLSIDKVFHKAFVEVNEQGTEAAAATAVVMTEGAALTTRFEALHPFLFLIRDRTDGAILFMGRVSDPRT